MGFTPLKAFIGGGANFAQKVAFARLEGEYELKKATGIAQAKALADKPPTTSFKAGNVQFTFTEPQAKDAKERSVEGIENIFSVMDKQGGYNKFAEATKLIPDGASKLQGLNNYLKKRVGNYANQHRFFEGEGNKSKFVSYKDLASVWKQAMKSDKGYGDKYNFLNVVAEGYALKHDTFKNKYKNQFPFETGKAYDVQNGFIKHSHIPFWNKENASTESGKYVLKNAQEIGKKLNMKFHKVMDAFEIGTGDKAFDIDYQAEVYKLYNDMKKELYQSEGIKKGDINLIDYDTLAKHRNKAAKLGLSLTKFGLLIETLLAPEFSGDNTPDGVLYQYPSERDRRRNKLIKDQLYEEFSIDKEAVQNEMGGAIKAGQIAKNMLNELDRGIAEGGSPGEQQPFVSWVWSKFEGILGKTGIVQNIGSWKRNDTGMGVNRQSRSRMQTKLDEWQRVADSDTASARVKRTARLNLMRFNLAYAMASALQGGTGGRTISDQDVENMMNAIKFGQTDSVASMRASLEQIQKIMLDIEQINNMYLEGGRKIAVGHILRKTNLRHGMGYFTQGGNPLVGYVMSRLEGGKDKFSADKTGGNLIKYGPDPRNPDYPIPYVKNLNWKQGDHKNKAFMPAILDADKKGYNTPDPDVKWNATTNKWGY